MRTGRPKTYTVTLSDDEREQLQPLAQSLVCCRAPLSKSTVHRYFTLFGIQPHRTRHFKLSTAPFFVEKGRDIVGLSLNPPDKALVLCVDEKSHIQALERSQPVLPMGLGYIEGITHEDFRHGTPLLCSVGHTPDNG